VECCWSEWCEWINDANFARSPRSMPDLRERNDHGIITFMRWRMDKSFYTVISKKNALSWASVRNGFTPFDRKDSFR
jgi:hypothetical protein